MGSDNVVVVVSNNALITEFINSKLVLLRDVDKVEHTNTIDALDFIREKIPNIIMLHAESSDNKRLKLVSDIRSIKSLKQIPIIVIAEKCSPEYLVEMFDAGISDIILAPIKEHELLFRVMWNIQKSDEYSHREMQDKFLANLGIVQTETGFYNKKYCEEFIKNQVDYAVEHKQFSCVMYIKVQNLDGEENNSKVFSKILKKSIRLNDWAGIASKNEYYVFFPKTKLNGTFSAFERLKRNSGFNYKITASVIEVGDKTFDRLDEFLKNSIKETDDAGSSLIVASDSAIRQRKIENQTVIGDDEIKRAFNAVVRRNTKKIILKDKEPKQKTVVSQAIKDYEETVDKSEDMEIRNAIAFKQIYKSKCKIVLGPVFKKFKTKIENAEKYIFVEYDVDHDESYFKISKGAHDLILSLKYLGLSSVIVETSHIFNNRVKDSDKVDVDITKINTKFINFVLDELVQSLKTC